METIKLWRNILYSETRWKCKCSEHCDVIERNPEAFLFVKLKKKIVPEKVLYYSCQNERVYLCADSKNERCKNTVKPVKFRQSELLMFFLRSFRFSAESRKMFETVPDLCHQTSLKLKINNSIVLIKSLFESITVIPYFCKLSWIRKNYIFLNYSLFL